MQKIDYGYKNCYEGVGTCANIHCVRLFVSSSTRRLLVLQLLRLAISFPALIVGCEHVWTLKVSECSSWWQPHAYQRYLPDFEPSFLFLFCHVAQHSDHSWIYALPINEWPLMLS